MISRVLKSHKLDGTANAIRKQAFRLRALLLRRFFSAKHLVPDEQEDVDQVGNHNADYDEDGKDGHQGLYS